MTQDSVINNDVRWARATLRFCPPYLTTILNNSKLSEPLVEESKMENKYKLRKSLGKGEGIFATKPFKTGEIVIIGIIEKVLDKNDSHASQIGEHKFIRHAGLIPKINHSCEPNCGIRINKTGAHDIIAMKDIAVGEEITIDYAMRNYTIDYFPNKCRCGSEKCRGTITGWKYLPKEIREEYHGFVAPYLLKL